MRGPTSTQKTDPQRTDLAWFNAADPKDLRTMLWHCVSTDKWIDMVLEGRPYACLRSLLERSNVAIANLEPSDILEAIAQHPRIGERADADGRMAEWLAQEQSSVGSPDPVLAEQLRAANARYEERFGYMYLVSAIGLDGPTIIADLDSRMSHTADVEMDVVRAELGKIAKSRLQRTLRD